MDYIRSGQYKVLSDSDLHDIHIATLEILEEVGVRVEYRPALELMADCGCRVDFKERIVKIPEHVLRKALSSAPSFFTLYGKTPEFDVKVDTQRIYTIGGSSALFVLDLDGNRHPATKKDLEELTRLQDALENLHIMHAIVIPQDIEQEGFDRILFSTVIKNTSRNYYSQGMGGQSIRDQVEMASVILGSTEEVRRRPIFTIVVCLTSPLTHAGIRVEELMESAKYNIPLYIEADAQPGATTPVTLAGTLVEQSANILCGITLAQMVNPGTPMYICYSFRYTGHGNNKLLLELHLRQLFSSGSFCSGSVIIIIFRFREEQGLMQPYRMLKLDMKGLCRF